MTLWEYEVIVSTTINVGYLVKHQNSKGLDPEVNDWMERATQDQYGHDEGRVVWSKARKCWTVLSNVLTELGLEGWELTGVSPDLNPHSSTPEYHLYFKRPASN